MPKGSKYARPTYQYKRKLGGRTRRTTVTILDTHLEQMELMIENDGGSVSGIVGDALDMYLANHPLIITERVKDATAHGKSMISEMEYLIETIKENKEKERLEKEAIAKVNESLEKPKGPNRKQLELNFGRTLHEVANGEKVLWYKSFDEWEARAHNDDAPGEGYEKKNQIPSDLMRYYEIFLDTL